MNSRIRASATLLSIVLFSACAAATNATVTDYDLVPSSPHGNGGELRIHDFKSRIFGNTRKLRVLLPRDYDAPENQRRIYPVLYMNDGQNLFDSTTSIFNPIEWSVDETVARLAGEGAIPPMIVVGIDNAGRRGRAHEYLRYPDQFLSPPEPNPRGAQYPDFLAKEVVPFVSEHYRVSVDPKHVGVGGSSYGGLAALYSAFTHPELFGLLLVESPSLYVDHGHVLRDVERAQVNDFRVYLGVGSNEDGKPTCNPEAVEDAEPVADVRRLERLLLQKGLDSTKLRVMIVPCAKHDEAEWGARFPTALKFLFGE